MCRTNTNLIESHLCFAEALAREIAKELPGRIPFDDLRQAAFLGLAESAGRFDPSLGVAFTTFAHPRIRGAVWDAVRRMRDVPPQLRSRARRQSLFASACDEHGIQIEHAAGSPRAIESILRDAIELAGTVTLLSDLAGNEGEFIERRAVGRRPRDPSIQSEAERQELEATVRKAVSELPPRLRTVVQAIAFEGRRQVDLAAERGCDKSVINRLWKAGLQRLRPVLGRALGMEAAAAAG